ncbi:hypothetical protein M501DRAFT_986614 [Patellaria atrata CBS 101060]|uniref:Uncharacterized protein n=1 Tax=Patellaria atrata CBS 101060 TaxID=1346257 RepID=A0A9P4VQ07_9PEZI|nr:hypothetical protein M501DRAFT_986614 [Patellaria atrata CBS 101060]
MNLPSNLNSPKTRNPQHCLSIDATVTASHFSINHSPLDGKSHAQIQAYAQVNNQAQELSNAQSELARVRNTYNELCGQLDRKRAEFVQERCNHAAKEIKMRLRRMMFKPKTWLCRPIHISPRLQLNDAEITNLKAEIDQLVGRHRKQFEKNFAKLTELADSDDTAIIQLQVKDVEIIRLRKSLADLLPWVEKNVDKETKFDHEKAKLERKIERVKEEKRVEIRKKDLEIRVLKEQQCENTLLGEIKELRQLVGMRDAQLFDLETSMHDKLNDVIQEFHFKEHRITELLYTVFGRTGKNRRRLAENKETEELKKEVQQPSGVAEALTDTLPKTGEIKGVPDEARKEFHKATAEARSVLNVRREDRENEDGGGGESMWE